ncbi:MULTISPECIES: hypothetical protein [unclassified Vibrio]|uniref:hypothetical protein n=2 Tax=Vibrio TaxID=662 RepID=UPI000B8EDF62|nr:MULTISPECIES: hypothetical protein [unclassified Vibrio]NAW90822.1 hypothetical protein [Vibrio sp. V24_P1S3T111]OXX29315.1 hypothetical protein B9J95_13750 [Vibrio sp. V14_P6S14T42]OXX31302.1 hypothetical protein B9J81_14330 [Vibrio sp. V04_P4A5T148]
MKISLPLVPRTDKMNNVLWLFNTRKYISRFDVYSAYKAFFDKEPDGTPTVEEMVNVFESSEENEAKITVKIVSHNFERASVDKYLNEEATKYFGIALAIEYRMLDKIIKIADDSDVFLYLTEYSLNQEELLLIDKNGLIEKISKRLVDKKLVMFTTLLENFEKLLKASDGKVINSDFVSRYIDHASFYNENTLLKYIFEKFTDSHPSLEKLDSLSWDPFTKSRRFSHWLNVCNRMDDISRYYLEIESENEVIKENKRYIKAYLEFKGVYS